MIDQKTKDELTELGREIKDLFPDVTGYVQFNLSKQMSNAKVMVMISDVTEAKK